MSEIALTPENKGLRHENAGNYGKKERIRRKQKKNSAQYCVKDQEVDG